MNYSDRVTLHTTLSSGYDPQTGKHGVQVDEGITLPCNASPVSMERANAMFGIKEQRITTVRLQRPFKGKADKAVLNGEKYNVLRHLPHRSESVFYLEGVSEWT
ncbi:hypothetical protein EQV77_00905 [Halobacillus fulvus]|nr:hypothetical protein EQV77_00905 [Halobacillus fulvus]